MSNHEIQAGDVFEPLPLGNHTGYHGQTVTMLEPNGSDAWWGQWSKSGRLHTSIESLMNPRNFKRLPRAEVKPAASAPVEAKPEPRAHDFSDRYLTFVEATGREKIVALCCKACGTLNTDKKNLACPGPRDWSAVRLNDERMNAKIMAALDVKAKKEREDQAELQKRLPRPPGPRLLHAGNLVGGPQFGAWRREGC